jgi:hypothetical protein
MEISRCVNCGLAFNKFEDDDPICLECLNEQAEAENESDE